MQMLRLATSYFLIIDQCHSIIRLIVLGNSLCLWKLVLVCFLFENQLIMRGLFLGKSSEKLQLPLFLSFFDDFAVELLHFCSPRQLFYCESGTTNYLVFTSRSKSSFQLIICFFRLFFYTADWLHKLLSPNWRRMD